MIRWSRLEPTDRFGLIAVVVVYPLAILKLTGPLSNSCIKSDGWLVDHCLIIMPNFFIYHHHHHSKTFLYLTEYLIFNLNSRVYSFPLFSRLSWFDYLFVPFTIWIIKIDCGETKNKPNSKIFFIDILIHFLLLKWWYIHLRKKNWINEWVNMTDDPYVVYGFSINLWSVNTTQ